MYLPQISLCILSVVNQLTLVLVFLNVEILDWPRAGNIKLVFSESSWNNIIELILLHYKLKSEYIMFHRVNETQSYLVLFG